MSNGMVLIVDDEPDFAGILSRALEQEGYLALRADSTRQALTLVSKGPQVILLDIILKRECGWEVLRLLRQFSSVPIILMTGADIAPETAADAKLLGAQAMLQKPFEIAALLEAVAAAIRNTPN